jgi:septum formation protein
MTQIDFVLASASAARKRLLQSMGISARVVASNFDEDSIQCENPIELVETLSRCKAETVSASLNDPCLVLGCDSILCINGEIHGKPQDAAVAFDRWQQMRGNRGILYTGHTLIDRAQQRQIVRCGITHVYFAKVSDADIRAYIATGEPLFCAGSFALEGKGGALVERIEGCHTNVIGLSMPLLRSMLAELGYNLGQLW